MTIKKGAYLYTVTCKGHKEIIVGLDFVETFNRACKHFFKAKTMPKNNKSQRMI